MNQDESSLARWAGPEILLPLVNKSIFDRRGLSYTTFEFEKPRFCVLCSEDTYCSEMTIKFTFHRRQESLNSTFRLKGTLTRGNNRDEFVNLISNFGPALFLWSPAHKIPALDFSQITEMFHQINLECNWPGKQIVLD